MDLSYSQYIMKAKKPDVCYKTGVKIEVGEQIMYLKGIRNRSRAAVYCKQSKFYRENEKSVKTGWKV